jgi:hypothetical protein
LELTQNAADLLIGQWNQLIEIGKQLMLQDATEAIHNTSNKL